MPNASDHTLFPSELQITDHALSRRAILGKAFSVGAAALVVGATVNHGAVSAQDVGTASHTHVRGGEPDNAEGAAALDASSPRTWG